MITVTQKRDVVTLELIGRIPEHMLTSFTTVVTLKQKLYLELFENTLGLGKQELVRRLMKIGIARYLEEYYPVINRDMTILEWSKAKGNEVLETSRKAGSKEKAGSKPLPPKLVPAKAKRKVNK